MEPGFYEKSDRWQTRIIEPLTKGGLHFKTPGSFKTILNTANNAKMCISTPSTGYSWETDKFDAPAYDAKVQELVTLLTSGPNAPFPGVRPTIRKYIRPVGDAQKAQFAKTSKGKMLIEYTSNKLDEKAFKMPVAGQTALIRV